MPLAVLPPMSDFERLSGDHSGHPLLELTLPTVSIDAGDTSLKLTPRSSTYQKTCFARGMR
jgi:hypothetical protein